MLEREGIGRLAGCTQGWRRIGHVLMSLKLVWTKLEIVKREERRAGKVISRKPRQKKPGCVSSLV